MESPNMYDSQTHQVGQQQQLQGELKKSAQIINQSGNNNNNNNNSSNNNNSNLQVNHNQQQQQQQQQSNGVSKVSASKASLHQQYAEHCAAAGELTDLNTPEISLDLQHLIDDSHFNDGLLDMLGATGGGGSSGNSTPLKHARLPVGSSVSGSNSYPRAAAAAAAAAAALAYMPQPVHSAASYHHGSNSCSDSNSSSSDSPSIKEEPMDMDPSDYRRHCSQFGSGPGGPYNPQPPGTNPTGVGPFSNPGGQTFTTLTSTTLPGNVHPSAVIHPQQQQQHQQHQQQQQARSAMKPVMSHHHTSAQQQQQQHHHHHHQGSGLGSGSVSARKQSKSVDKASDEYRRRRERNNIAVRKSREKAKVRSRETEERVKQLVKENEMLRKKVDVLGEELSVLRSLFGTVGALPEQMQRELSRHIDQFQQHVGGPQI